jgi:hypothetical protein
MSPVLLNWVLLIVCGVLSVAGMLSWGKAGSPIRPLHTIGAVIVFFLALASILMGVSIIDLKSLIERGFR